MRVSVLAAVVVLAACADAAARFPGMSRPVDKKDNPVVRDRCPPEDKAHIPADADVNGPELKDKPPRVDWLIGSWHWDDGKGNDLTLQLWCVDNPALEYLSLRLIQSKDGKNTVVAAPGGFKATENTGDC